MILDLGFGNNLKKPKKPRKTAFEQQANFALKMS
jgi:hypothetical protein